jgi:hypothetical protein
MNPKVFFLVGKANWGKSETIRYFVGDSRHLAWIELGSFRISVKHMSNKVHSLKPRFHQLSNTSYRRSPMQPGCLEEVRRKSV